MSGVHPAHTAHPRAPKMTEKIDVNVSNVKSILNDKQNLFDF